jgi:Ca-activated chloride channel family protein
MNLGAPQMLWLLVALVLPLIVFFWWAWRERQRLIAQFISARLLAILKVGVSATRQKARMAMIVAAVALLVLALARPQWGFTREEARQRGLDLIMVVDTSNSMLAEDVQPNRLARAKLAALDLARRARTDRLGLVAFAGNAFLECPLTLDDAAFSESVASLDTRTISQGGTAIGEAIDEARRAFKKDSGNHKVIVLFTDGEDHDSDAAAAAEKAAASGIIIFTVGIGTPEGELLRIHDERGRLDYIRDEQGNPVKSHLNEELLQQIAGATKGFYLHLSGTGTMDTLYDRGIGPLPKSENSSRLFQRYVERFYWPLSFAIILLIAEVFLPERKRKRSSPATAATDRAATAGMVETAALILLLAVPFAAHGGGASSALQEYNDGKFQDALKDYDQLLEKKQDDPRLHFNAGAAAYQGKKMDEAAKQFNQALTSPDLELQQRAYYNLGNTLYRLGQELPDASKKQEAWENALKQYTNALSLNKADTDADFNRGFVERQLEELKKQQSQSQSQNDKQQQKDKQDKKQDQKNQGQNNPQQNKEDQQKDSQSQQNQDKSKQDQNSQAQNQDQQKSDQQKQQDRQQQDQSQAQKQDEQQKQAQKQDQSGQDQSASEAKDKSDEEAKQEAAMMAAGQMTPQQAKQLLDSQKDDEQVLRLSPPNKNTLQSRSFKDW